MALSSIEDWSENFRFDRELKMFYEIKLNTAISANETQPFGELTSSDIALLESLLYSNSELSSQVSSFLFACTGDCSYLEPNDEQGKKTEVTVSIDTQLSIYPNPSKEWVRMELKSDVKLKEVIITDISGKIILRQVISDKFAEINVSDFDRGVYIITVIRTDNKSFHRKFIKQ